jgi:hypothetical protein
MARTYWLKQPDNTYEFLGAFRDGHQANPKQPQAKASVLDITDLPDPQAVVDKLGMESRESPPRLVNLPSAIGKRLTARMVWSGPWAQIEGFVK